MSIIPNTRKDFKFALEIGGLNQFYVQKITPPKRSLGVVEHGSSALQPNTKTPGKYKIGQLVLEKVMPSDKQDKWSEEWFLKARMGLRAEYTFFGVLHHLGEKATTNLASYELGECWVSDITPSAFDRMGENNIIETITLEVDRYELRGSGIYVPV